MRPATVLTVMCLALTGAVAHATTVLDLPLDQLAARASIVCRGTIIDTKAEWYGDHAAIVTRVRVRVTEAMKGSKFAPAGREIVVMEAGGVVDGIGQAVPGAAHFDVGEEVVLFLEPAPRDQAMWILPTMAASKFHVTTGSDGSPLLEREVAGLSFVARDESGRLRTRTSERETTVALSKVRTMLRSGR